MKAITSLVLLLSFNFINTTFVSASLPQEKNRLAKEERRKIREIEEIENFNKTAILINQLNFVLKADYLVFKDGQIVAVDSKINFIIVDTIKTTIQTGQGEGVGDNGVGGITADGTISKLQIKENSKRKSFSVSFNLSTITGRFNISMDIEADGKTRANIISMSKGLLITLNGKVVDLKGSGIFKGSAYY